MLGLEDEAKAFHNTLEDANLTVSPRSREFWRRAAERALNLRPDLEIDDEEDTTLGPIFLREFELQRQERLAQAGRSTGAQDQAGTKAGDNIQGKAPNDVAQGVEASEDVQTGQKAADEGQEEPEKDENALHKPEISGKDQRNGTKVADGATINTSNPSGNGGEQVIEGVHNKEDKESTS